jgi:phytoene/squalene synthetase
LYYFIGHDDPTPICHETRYLAVTAAHITHMLRDALEDADNGYFNIPGEYLAARGISPQDVKNSAYREWVCGRVQLAREYFKAGRECTSQITNLRCRLASYAYTSRFEWMLNAIERDNYCLRSEYPERKSLFAGLWMSLSTFSSMFAARRTRTGSRGLAPQSVRIDKQ